MIHKCATVAACLFLLPAVTVAQTTGASEYSQRNAINFNPLGFLFGSLGANYEHLFGNENGLFLEGGYVASSVAGGFNTALHYRRHYHTKPNHSGMNSPFWGPFIYYENSSTEIPNPESGSPEEYDVDIQYLKAGVNWGRRWIFGKTFNLVFRIGYGFPLIADFEWQPGEPEEVETIETVTKIIAGIDGELSIGFAF